MHKFSFRQCLNLKKLELFKDKKVSHLTLKSSLASLQMFHYFASFIREVLIPSLFHNDLLLNKKKKRRNELPFYIKTIIAGIYL